MRWEPILQTARTGRGRNVGEIHRNPSFVDVIKSSFDKEYVQQERQQRAWVTRYALACTVFTVIAISIQSMQMFRAEAAVTLVTWALMLGIALFAAYFWASTRAYGRTPILDLILFAPMIFFTGRIGWVLASQLENTGWTPHATVAVNHLTAVAFASLFFPANLVSYAVSVALIIGSMTYYASILGGELVVLAYYWTAFLPIALITGYGAYAFERKSLQSFWLSQALGVEKAKSEKLLYSILPEEVAMRLREGKTVADSFSDATIVFIDLVGSSELARSLSPRHFIATLNDVFSIADAATSIFNVEKVKTIGDAYLAVAGARGGGDVMAALKFSQHVILEVQRLAHERRLDLNVRVGVHSGPVIGGVIGTKQATYDYWGDTMNIAARVEAVALPGGISVTKQIYYATQCDFSYLPLRKATLKGIGEVEIYDVAVC